MFVLLPIHVTHVACYAAALQLLRRALGAKAPSLPDLIAMEMTNRRPRTIAEEYLDFKGYPPLRVCRQRLAEQRQTAAKPSRGATTKSRTPARVIARPLAPDDPGRN